MIQNKEADLERRATGKVDGNPELARINLKKRELNPKATQKQGQLDEYQNFEQRMDNVEVLTHCSGVLCAWHQTCRLLC